MRILHVAAELAPLAKVGGLADVVHGLSRAQIALGHTVDVLLPKYDTLGIAEDQTLVDGIPITLIPSPYFERGVIYGCEDDFARYINFCTLVVERLVKGEFQPDIIHLHDWHTALIAPLLKELHPEISAKIVFTIHNLAYQGECAFEALKDLGLPCERMKEGEIYNMMKGGILYSDHITTVSPTYAQEILTTTEGRQLRKTLEQCKDKFSGLLNGIDYSYWNPATDLLLPVHFSLEEREKKSGAKAALRTYFSLEASEGPLVGAVTRLVPQKGPEMIKAALIHTVERGGQFILLGSSPDPKIQAEFEELEAHYRGNPHVHLELTYNEAYSHILFGGCDLFLVPSIFEPCGLTQMIAMRYGALPLVRKTGGLADTVIDGENGFTFVEPTATAINTTLDRAFQVWKEDSNQWKAMQLKGMESDFSWKKPAQAYQQLYDEVLKKRLINDDFQIAPDFGSDYIKPNNHIVSD